jgi:hypothetical protein
MSTRDLNRIMGKSRKKAKREEEISIKEVKE